MNGNHFAWIYGWQVVSRLRITRSSIIEHQTHLIAHAPPKGAAANQQGVEVLEQWRHHEFIAKTPRDIEDDATQVFDLTGLNGQNIGNGIRENPGGPDEGSGC